MEPTHFESLYPANTREKEIEKILSFVKAGNSCQIIGLPGVGRSNLLGMLAYNRAVRIKHLGENQKNFHFVVVNFSEIRKRPLLDATKFLFLCLVDSLRDRKREEEYRIANDVFRESVGFNDELVLFQGLKRVIDLLALEKKLTIVLLFDRFETYIPMLTPEFFTNLRAIRNRAKFKFSVVFSLERPLEDVLEGSLFGDFYEFLAGHIVYIPITDKPGIDFRISHLEKTTGKTIDKKLLAEMLRLTGGFGKLTKACAETLLASSNQRLASSSLGELFLGQKTVRSSLWEIWSALTPEEQKSLLVHLRGGVAPAAHLGGDSDGWAYLENVGLVKEGKLTIPLFEEFIKTIVPSTMKQLSNETIVYNTNTNEIKKGEQLISDKLTSSEFKLLKFLIQNTEKILGREEVISSVWADAKSTAGVTDQALDQLIFRLRKKIEDDPNNPTHVQTIKGRGLRFNP